MDTIPETQDATVGRSESDLLVFISSVTEELKWAREEAVRTIDALTYARSWAFEFTPATSQCRTDTYLQKVREADFVIWLVASKTTQPVVNEITESIATSRRLLVFKFPSEHRDQSTQELLETVSTYSKWHDLDSPTALSQALKASIFDELINRDFRFACPGWPLYTPEGRRAHETLFIAQSSSSRGRHLSPR